MKIKSLLILLVSLLLFSISDAKAAALNAGDIKDINKALVSARTWIKQGNYEKAMFYTDFEEVGKILMKGYWDKLSQNDKNEITSFMKNTLKTKFHIIQKRLAGLKFNNPRIDEGKVLCRTVVVFDRSVDKKDQVVDIYLVKKSTGWKLVDIYILGEGFISGLNEDKVRPIMKKSGKISDVKNTIKVVFE
jgi:ABC-type transporter MlaC component